MVNTKESKPIEEIKKGDIIKIDGKPYEVDAHYVLIDHGNTKEMAIELFDKKSDKDYQLRYFSGQIKDSLRFFMLKEVVYDLIEMEKVEW